MKQFIVTQKQKANLSQLRDYFEVLPKTRINQRNGSVSLYQNPYTKQCCVATHMAICLNMRPACSTTRKFKHSIWREKAFLKKHLGVSFKKFKKLSGISDPWGMDTWEKSPKKVFNKLYNNAVVHSES